MYTALNYTCGAITIAFPFVTKYLNVIAVEFAAQCVFNSYFEIITHIFQTYKKIKIKIERKQK